MCGIVGYIGQPQSDREHGALDVLMEGLRRLEYRGYDSAGVAVVDGGQLYHRKKAGKLANLAEDRQGIAAEAGAELARRMALVGNFSKRDQAQELRVQHDAAAQLASQLPQRP